MKFAPPWASVARDPAGGGRPGLGGGVALRAGQVHDQRAGTLGITREESLGLECLELMGDAGGGGQAHGLAHLTDRGRVPAFGDGRLDRLEDQALSEGEPLGVGRAIRQGTHFAQPGEIALAGAPPPILPGNGDLALAVLLRHTGNLGHASWAIKHLFDRVAMSGEGKVSDPGASLGCSRSSATRAATPLQS